jgi:hypothetical protein
MNRPLSSSSLSLKESEEHASLLNEIWLMTDKNDFIRDSYIDSPLDELKTFVDRLKKTAKLSPEENSYKKFCGVGL